jgi:hypothetical protein
MSIRRSIISLVLGASMAIAISAPSAALADTAVPGSKYAVVFNGTGSENVSWQSVVQGNPSPSSGQQAGTWTINDNNNGPGVWIPATKSPAEEGLSQSFPAWRDVFDANGHPVPTPASISESGNLCCDGDPPHVVPYTCTASSLYDNGMGTLTFGVTLGHAVLTTQYGNNNRTFLAGHPDPNDPNGVSLDGGLSCRDASNGSYYGTTFGGFVFPGPNGAGTDRIAYTGSVPFSSVGQSKITVPATDQSHITTSADCDPSDTMDFTSCGVHVSIKGSYTLTKVCDGAINYTATGLTGTCGESPPAGTAKGAGSAQASGNGTVTVGSSSCAGPGSCTDTTTVTSSGGGTHATKKVVYGHAKVTVAAGKTAKLKVKLTKAALKALKKAGKLKTTVTIVITSQGGRKVTKHFKLTIKAPR